MRSTLSRCVASLLMEGSAVAAGALLLEGLSRLLLLEREGRISLGASLSLLAIATLLQTLAAAVIAPARAFMHAKRWQRVLFLGLWVGVPAWFSLSPVTTDLTSGVWIREQSYAGALRWGLLSLATAGAVALTSIVFDPSPRFRRTRIAVMLALGLA